ncbi:MAG TPA: DNA-3-methyladenine glycosylase [Kofleriaceae bacterium]|nr:DNA-3-methyladenine glycosylase [Kofleriaceae bacterium]
MRHPPYLPAALRHLRRADPQLGRLIKRHGPPRLKPSRNHLESLTRAIIYQQLSGKAAATIYRRFLDLFGGRFPSAAELAAIPMARLRGAGLSGAKAEYVLDLARRVADGSIDPRRFRRMEDEALIAHLTQVKGIGRWSVHMFLLFGLGRPDVLPTGDLGVRKGMQLLFRLPDLPAPSAMEELAEPWRPYRSIASWYMWRLLE